MFLSNQAWTISLKLSLKFLPPTELKSSSPRAKHVPPEGENPSSPFESSRADLFQLHHFGECK